MNQAVGLLWEVVRGQEGGGAVPQFLGWVQDVTQRARIVLPGFVGLTRAGKRPGTAAKNGMGEGTTRFLLTRPHNAARDALGCTPELHPAPGGCAGSQPRFPARGPPLWALPRELSQPAGSAGSPEPGSGGDSVAGARCPHVSRRRHGRRRLGRQEGQGGRLEAGTAEL